MAGGVTSLEKIRGDLIGQSCRDGAKISRLGGVKMREMGLLMFFCRSCTTEGGLSILSPVRGLGRDSV